MLPRPPVRLASETERVHDVGTAGGAARTAVRPGSPSIVLAVGSAGGAQFRAAVPTGSGFLPPPPRTVRAVLPHTAHRRPSPPAFGFPVQGLNGLGATTVPLRLISPIRFVDR